MKMFYIIPIIFVVVLLAGCSIRRNQIMDGDVDAKELKEILGDGDVTVEFLVEWTE